MKKLYKKIDYSEYIVNNSRIKKLYHIYLHQTVFDKVLDVLVAFAILFTFVEVFSMLFFALPSIIINAFHSFTVFIIFIFGLELFREYSHSKTNKQFFKKHGIDFFLVLFLSLYFFSATYFGAARFRGLANLSKYAGKFKQLKIISRIGSLLS